MPTTFRSCIITSLTMLLVIGISLGLEAQQKKKRGPIRTQSEAEAGPDFLVQGEYIGTLMQGGKKEKFGVQVIARGKGTFEAKGFPGGLPGAGWDLKSKLSFSRGSTEGATTKLSEANKKYTLVIKNKRMKVLDAGGNEVGSLERIIRKSPTLGKKPPEGAVVLFDGTTAKNFRTRKDREKNIAPPLTPEGFLKLERGSRGLETLENFGSCFMHLEFRLPFEPQGGGQGRANSGCYFQGRYEVQILDSFGLPPTQSDCGGLYSSGVHPAVNMCFPPLSWQTYDVEFTAAQWKDGKKIAKCKLTVYHNGVRTYLDQTVPKDTTASPEKEKPGPMYHYLQDHGHELWFKNIWLIKR